MSCVNRHYKQQQSGVKGQLELSVNELKNVRNELEAIKKEKIALKHQVSMHVDVVRNK